MTPSHQQHLTDIEQALRHAPCECKQWVFDECARCGALRSLAQLREQDDAQRRDAERYNKLLSMIDVESTPGTFEVEYRIGNLGEYKHVGEPIMDGEHLTKTIDAALTANADSQRAKG